MRSLILALSLLAASPAAAQEIRSEIVAAADGTRTLWHELAVPAAIGEVWQAVATPDGWRSWAVPLARAIPGTSDRFETGYAPDLPPGAPATIEQQWLERTAPHRAVFRTTRTPTGFPHAEAYMQVTSAFTLTAIGPAETRIRLTASGYPAGPAGDALIAFFRDGNAATLRNLRLRFTKGPIDWTRPQPEK